MMMDIYHHVLCSCKENFISESKRNLTTRWEQHNPTHDSEPAKHLSNNF